jgi:hypothetical protein
MEQNFRVPKKKKGKQKKEGFFRLTFVLVKFCNNLQLIFKGTKISLPQKFLPLKFTLIIYSTEL